VPRHGPGSDHQPPALQEHHHHHDFEPPEEQDLCRDVPPRQRALREGARHPLVVLAPPVPRDSDPGPRVIYFTWRRQACRRGREHAPYRPGIRHGRPAIPARGRLAHRSRLPSPEVRRRHVQRLIENRPRDGQGQEEGRSPAAAKARSNSSSKGPPRPRFPRRRSAIRRKNSSVVDRA